MLKKNKTSKRFTDFGPGILNDLVNLIRGIFPNVVVFALVLVLEYYTGEVVKPA